VQRISGQPFYLFPGEYIVVTENAASIAMQYHVKDPDALMPVSALPSMPDDKGRIVILNTGQEVVDEVGYNDDWHFGLIAIKEGVSLERIDPDGISEKKTNWHSAASTAGYGTPGYRNSQFKRKGDMHVRLSLSPEIFSPDNDGVDDIAVLAFKAEGIGTIANITIFDANGKHVRYLVRNDLMGVDGSWHWDGLGENNKKLSVGTYIIRTELFNLEGKKEEFRHTIVLARKQN
jgi:hypothetical protein